MQSLNGERGSVIVFVTLMIVLLLIMVGIGLDTGQLTATRSQGQAAVDAAALAAVSGLPSGNPADVNQRVSAFNSSNDYVKSSSNPIGSRNITYVHYDELSNETKNLSDITGANGVRVALETNAGTAITTPVFLTPLMNLFGQSVPSTVDVNVSAIAALRALPSLPIAIKEVSCDHSNIRLRETGPAISANACWTTYTDPDTSDSRVQDLFDASTKCTGLPANTDRVAVETPIQLSNSSVPSIYSNAENLFSSTSWSCWIVPVVDKNASCSSPQKISRWAQLCPVKNPSGSGYITANVTCNPNISIFRATDNLCFSPRLLRDTKSGM